MTDKDYDLSDVMWTWLSDHDVDVSDSFVVICMTLIGQQHVNFLTNEYVTSQRKDLTSQHKDLTRLHKDLTSSDRNMPP